MCMMSVKAGSPFLMAKNISAKLLEGLNRHSSSFSCNMSAQSGSVPFWLYFNTNIADIIFVKFVLRLRKVPTLSLKFALLSEDS